MLLDHRGNPYHTDTQGGRVRVLGESILQKHDPGASDYYKYPLKPVFRDKEIPTDFHKQVDLVSTFAKYDPLTRTVLSIMVQFAARDVIIESPSDYIKDYFQKIYQNANINRVVECLMYQYFTYANAFPYRYIGKQRREIRDLNNNPIPNYQWTLFNPLNVEVERNMFGESLIYFIPSDEWVKQVKQKGELGEQLRKNIPPNILKQINEKKWNGRIALSPWVAGHIRMGAMPYENYGTPFILSLVNSLLKKDLLRQTDAATLAGFVNSIVHVTKGPVEGQWPTADDLDELASLLQTPSKAFTLVTDESVKINIIAPDTSILNPEKHTAIDRDIANGFGITSVLITGEGSGAARNHWINITSLIERLENARKDILDYLHSENEKIAEENQLDAVPMVKLDKMRLREEVRIREILLRFYQQGLISADTILRESDFDLNVELNKRRLELMGETEGVPNAILLTPPQSPFQSPGRPITNLDRDSEDRIDRSQAEALILKQYQRWQVIAQDLHTAIYDQNCFLDAADKVIQDIYLSFIGDLQYYSFAQNILNQLLQWNKEYCSLYYSHIGINIDDWIDQYIKSLKIQMGNAVTITKMMAEGKSRIKLVVNLYEACPECQQKHGEEVMITSFTFDPKHSNCKMEIGV